jgi:hypothetical protein
MLEPLVHGSGESRSKIVQMRRRRKLIGLWAFALAAWVALPRVLPAPPGQGSRDEAFFEVYRRAEPITTWSLNKLHREIPELKGLQPASGQSQLPAILAGISQNLQSFWKHFADTTSLEIIDESRRPDESSGGMGSNIDLAAGAVPTGNNSGPTRRQEQFRYLMLLDPEDSEKLREYRTDLHGHEAGGEAPASNFAKTAGFASLPQFFDAKHQPLSDYRYFGSQVVDHSVTKVVAFAEHVNPAGVKGRFMFGATSVPILLEGVVWVDSGDYHMVRMRTDLLAPQPDAGLKRVTTVVLFQEVKFRDLASSVWLPQQVNVTLDLDNFTFTNRHNYSDYQVFSVSTDEKTKAPKTAPP